VGTLSEELGQSRSASWRGPRIYADANVRRASSPTCRQRLRWDVSSCSRSPICGERGREALPARAQLRRTLVTLDRDYLDDSPLSARAVRRRSRHSGARRAPVVGAARSHRSVAVPSDDVDEPVALPLIGRKLQVNTDWGRGTGDERARLRSEGALKSDWNLKSEMCRLKCVGPRMIGWSSMTPTPSRLPWTSRAICWRARRRTPAATSPRRRQPCSSRSRPRWHSPFRSF